MSLKVWKKLFPGAHIEQMRSDFAANEKYCSKEGQLIGTFLRFFSFDRSADHFINNSSDSGSTSETALFSGALIHTWGLSDTLAFIGHI